MKYIMKVFKSEFNNRKKRKGRREEWLKGQAEAEKTIMVVIFVVLL